MFNSQKTVDDYIKVLPEEKINAVKKLRATILENLPSGFSEQLGYGMPSYVVPHTIYSDGYHSDPKLPLPFISFASQKNAMSFYHMGIYANPELMKWFVKEYPKHTTRKLDMGKSCIRFKKTEEIPFSLIGELVAKMSVEDWIKLYEEHVKTAKF